MTDQRKYSIPQGIHIPSKPWAHSVPDLLKDLMVSTDKGLENKEVKKRRRIFGPNRLRRIKKKGIWSILANQFKSLIMILLAAAMIVAFVFGEFIEGGAIAVVIIINALIGFFTELKAVRSMEALRHLGDVRSKVKREGTIRAIPAQELVPGDIVLLEGGDMVTADLRLIQANKLQANESTLTGESVSVGKTSDILPEEIPFPERSNMLFKGTAITRGSGEGVVLATGMETELGKISSLAEEAGEEQTPLEKRLDRLAYKLVWVTLAITALIALGGILSGRETFLMIQTGLALAVAAIPQGLPIVATIALARGMWRMARRNALVNRLSAVETLGSTTIICTDKTGTLTENRMQLAVIGVESQMGDIDLQRQDDAHESTEWIQSGKQSWRRPQPGKNTDAVRESMERIKPGDDYTHSGIREILRVGMLCNNAYFNENGDDSEENAVGDPLEVALLMAAIRNGLRKDQILKEMPEVREEAFDPDNKMMATFHALDDHYYVAVKGAPESVIRASKSVRSRDGENTLSDDARREWLRMNEQLAEKGLRVLALGMKTVSSPHAAPYQNLTLLGLAGLADPPRDDVGKAIKRCQQAGIRVLMVTGDHPETARNIGLQVGLVRDHDSRVLLGKNLGGEAKSSPKEQDHIIKASIFARVSPRQKLDLIRIHQKKGSIVAMTGDGVNDAPALKKADIGIAMGRRGTEVARQASDMVLKDDAFSTIVSATEQGRVIFLNIRKFVFYLLSCNVSEVLIVSLASLFNAPLPILPLQILFLNIVTDVFPALALGAGEGNPDIMARPARDPKEPILAGRHWLGIAGFGLIIALSVTGSLVIGLSWLKLPKEEAVTLSFLTLAFVQLWHVFNMRDFKSSFLSNDITRNPFIWTALAICTGLLLAAVYVPAFAIVLEITRPDLKGWSVILSMSLFPWAMGQILKSLPLNRILKKHDG